MENKEVNQQDTVSTDSLLKRIALFLEDKEFVRADEYCERVLDIDPENAEAYLYKLMVSCRVAKKEELKNCEKPFDNNPNYQKIMRFGDEVLKKEISGCVKHITYRNEEQIKRNNYDNAVLLMTNETTRSLDEAISIFEQIKDFKDSENKIAQCRRDIEELKKKRVKNSKKMISIASVVVILISLAAAAIIGFGVLMYTKNHTTVDGMIFKKVGGEYTLVDYKKGIVNADIPESINSEPVTTIGDSAFLNCDSLESVTIPDSVTTIGDSAFFNCDSLQSITIPDSVIVIGDSVFSDCDSLTKITIPESVLLKLRVVFDYWNLTDIVLHESVTTIGRSAFSFCDALTSVTIPDSVTAIGDYAFYLCESLESVIIPDSVTTIGEGAFSYCRSLEHLVVPDSVVKIGEYAFWNCDNLTIECSYGKYVDRYAKENRIPRTS